MWRLILLAVFLEEYQSIIKLKSEEEKIKKILILLEKLLVCVLFYFLIVFNCILLS